MQTATNSMSLESIGPADFSRRELLWQLGGGLGGVALAAMLGEQGLLAAEPGSRIAPSGLHHPPKAKRVVQLFMTGAASHLDLFDYKPELVRRHDVGVIFYTIAHISPQDNTRILNICRRTGLHIVMLSEVLGLLRHQLKRSGPKPAKDAPDAFVLDQTIENMNA